MDPVNHSSPSLSQEIGRSKKRSVEKDDAFSLAYKRLNEAQKKAVDTIEGPVMVVAGPGTGKTQVLSLRVANILKKAQVNPRNVLSLTYTVSGATEMRERLREMIGAPAYAVTINTIHGFCNDIILANPHVFEAFSSLEQISDVEQLRSVNKIIDQLLPHLELVNKKNPHSRTKDIIGRMSQVKREGKTLDDLKRAADEYEAILLNKSKEGTKAHEKNASTARKFREFVRIYELYQEMLVSTQRYDYDDMILNALKALEEEDWLLQGLQERYLYVLVDEFQDTNGAQYRVIEKLITPRTPEDRPNIFVVGDDDQAIYRFQGANLQNILSFHKRFPDCPVIVLTTSYRCSQPILDAAGKLIAHNTERLVGTIPGLTKDLTSGRTQEGLPPTLLRTPGDTSDPWVIADIVEEQLKAGVEPGEIAILTQTNSELRPIYDVFIAREIPVQMDGKIDLLSHPLVLQTLSILRGITEPYSNASFSPALSAACHQCHPADLGRLYGLSIKRSEPILTLLLELDQPDSPLDEEPWHTKECLIKARDTLLSLHQQLENRTLVDTLEHILRECGMIVLAQSQAFNPLDFAALQAFFEYVQYRSYEQNSFGHASLLSDLEFYLNGEYGLRMSYALPHLSSEGVRLMTAHQSKGLEFDTVILANFRDGHWDKRRNPPSLSIPEDLLFGWGSDQKQFEQHQDERRVAYVAMTRARNTLLFLCPMQVSAGSKPKDVSPSGFFVEAGDLPEDARLPHTPEAMSTFLYTPAPNLDASYKAFLLERLKDFRLSVTALNHFLENPKIFLERDLLQSPQVKNETLVYGNAVHAAMKRWGMSVQDGLPLSQEQFLHEFDNYLTDREILTEAQRRNLIAHGQENLPRYYDQRLRERIPHVYRVEFPIATYLGDIPLKGKIDRIDLDHPDSAKATLIDFKTGRPKSEGQIREDGDYFRQLAFYAILMEHGMPLYEPVGYILDFIGEGTDHPVERRFQITKDEKTELSKIIGDVWTKIQNLDFTPL